MGFIEDFWANINAGATTIATAPDPIINIGQPRKKPTPTPTPTTTPTPTPTTTSGGNTPANTRRSDQQIYDLIESYHGDDISLLHGHAQDLGDQMNINWAKAEKQRNINAETFHRLHTEQEGRISENAEAIATHGHDYAGIDHTHSNDDSGDMPWYIQIVLILAGAFVVYMLLKKGIFG